MTPRTRLLPFRKPARISAALFTAAALSLAGCLNSPGSQDPIAKEQTSQRQSGGETPKPEAPKQEVPQPQKPRTKGDTVSVTPEGCPEGYMYVAVLWNGPGWCEAY